MHQSLSISFQIKIPPILTHPKSKPKPKPTMFFTTSSKLWRLYNSIINSSRAFHRPVSDFSSAAAAVTRFRDGESLYQVISRFGNPTISMTRILDRWTDDGRSVTRDELRFLVLLLKRRKRFTHALQVSEWYSSRNGVELSPRDVLFHLDLVSKVYGLNRAEKYFRTIPLRFRSYAYKALLNCYVYAKSVEKSEALMEKMKSMGHDLVRKAFPYNVMMRLYRRLGMYEKMDSIMDEMDVKGVVVDDFTYSTRLSAFVDACDIQGMESLLTRMEADIYYTNNWKDCIIAANGYIKAGLVDKAIDMLRKAELYSYAINRQYASHLLLTVYARAACKDDVYRIWNLYKKERKPQSKAYGCMVSSLIILGDLEGAEEIIEENLFNISLTFFPINLLLRAYGERGDMQKAKALVDVGIQYRKKPLVSTWDVMATGYCKNNDMDAAVHAMKKAGMVGPGRVNTSTYEACLQHLRMKGDSKELERFASLLRNKAYSSESSSDYRLNKEITRSDVNDQTDFNLTDDE